MTAINLEPFTRVLWKGKENKKIWQPRIEKVRKLYHNTEWQTFLKGYRKIYVTHLRPERLIQFTEDLNKYDLYFTPVTVSRSYQGFSHKHLTPRKGDEYYYYGGTAKDRATSIEFRDISRGKRTNHKRIGELLGYPECCINFFSVTWNNPSIDPLYEASLSTKDVDIEDGKLIIKAHPYTNQFLRYFGIRLTPHLVHSFSCKNTIEMGKKWVKVMRKLDDEATDWVIELLSMPFTWDCWKGVVIIDTPLFRGVTNSDSPKHKKIVNNLGWDKSL